MVESSIGPIAVGVAFSSCIISLAALIYFIRGDLRKSGLDIRCAYAIASSVESSEQWNI